MCELFIKADPQLWTSRTHSLRIDGVTTSIRIENQFWDTLAQIAQRDGLAVAQLITRLWHEAMDADHDLGNFTSFLRVCCARYHMMIASGAISPDLAVPISAYRAEDVPARDASLHRPRTN